MSEYTNYTVETSEGKPAYLPPEGYEDLSFREKVIKILLEKGITSGEEAVRQGAKASQIKLWLNYATSQGKVEKEGKPYKTIFSTLLGMTKPSKKYGKPVLGAAQVPGDDTNYWFALVK